MDEIEFKIDDESGVSSGIFITDDRAATAAEALSSTTSVGEDQSPVFRLLSDPKLPELPREPRGRLLMQSPTRLFFYWSVGANPYQALHKAIGGETQGFQLALRLLDVARGSEELYPVEPEGLWWFDVAPDTEYRAEVGFYAPSRPFIRLLFSNTVRTPRKTPSPRQASSADWMVSADKFADVLDVSGFREDAIETAMAGDGESAGAMFSPDAFAAYIGNTDVEGLNEDEIRFALMALADGVPLEYLKWKISARLFALLEANIDKLSSDARFAALRERFGMTADKFEFELTEPNVFGASLISFPKRFRGRFPKYSPISSSG